MALSDEEWIAEARRQLVSTGSWRIPITPAPSPPAATVPAADSPRCPWCVDRPPLGVFPRHEAVSPDPLYICRTCFGFWASGDCLLAGVADSGDEHEALYAALGPTRCRACGSRMRPDGSCRACGRTAPLLRCPACEREMARETRKGITLDTCPPCRGTWFDIGEIGRVFGLERPQSLAFAGVDEHAGPEDRELILRAIGVLARLFLPYLPIP